MYQIAITTTPDAVTMRELVTVINVPTGLGSDGAYGVAHEWARMIETTGHEAWVEMDPVGQYMVDLILD